MLFYFCITLNYAYNDSKEMNIFFNKIGHRTSKKGRDIDAESFKTINYIIFFLCFDSLQYRSPVHLKSDIIE